MEFTVVVPHMLLRRDHGRLKVRLADEGSKVDRTANVNVVIEGHAFSQNTGRRHYKLGVNRRAERLRCAAAFNEKFASIVSSSRNRIRSLHDPRIEQRNRAQRATAGQRRNPDEIRRQ